MCITDDIDIVAIHDIENNILRRIEFRAASNLAAGPSADIQYPGFRNTIDGIHENAIQLNTGIAADPIGAKLCQQNAPGPSGYGAELNFSVRGQRVGPAERLQ